MGDTATALEQPAFSALLTIRLRPSEWLVLGYFAYVAVFSAFRWREVPLLMAAVSMIPLASREYRTGARVHSIIRDWLTLAFLLVAYWTVDWFPQPVREHTFEYSWIHLDRLILNGWKLRSAIECAGPFVPFILEFCYSLLYALPAILVGVLYLYRRRDRVDRFVFTLLLGALTTYVLLPHFPSISPREVFSNQDLPASMTLFRSLNLWLLSNFDIHASVFPSSHVTVGFSAVFAMLLAFPERRRVAAVVLGVAICVALATVYGRYHYAVDVFAGIGVSILAFLAGAMLHPALSLSRLRRKCS